MDRGGAKAALDWAKHAVDEAFDRQADLEEQLSQEAEKRAEAERRSGDLERQLEAALDGHKKLLEQAEKRDADIDGLNRQIWNLERQQCAPRKTPELGKKNSVYVRFIESLRTGPAKASATMH